MKQPMANVKRLVANVKQLVANMKAASVIAAVAGLCSATASVGKGDHATRLPSTLTLLCNEDIIIEGHVDADRSDGGASIVVRPNGQGERQLSVAVGYSRVLERQAARCETERQATASRGCIVPHVLFQAVVADVLVTSTGDAATITANGPDGSTVFEFTGDVESMANGVGTPWMWPVWPPPPWPPRPEPSPSPGPEPERDTGFTYCSAWCCGQFICSVYCPSKATCRSRCNACLPECGCEYDEPE